jgi:hypothetical protein
LFTSHANARFRSLYAQLSDDVQKQADKQFALFRSDPFHPSLRLKPIGGVWSVRINRSYRALARRKDDSFYWFWIGTHSEYERILEPAH